MYKKIMLSLLFIPCMVLSKSDRDCQIEQLKNTQRDKEEEIALIIEQIDAKENLIDSIYFKIGNICPSLTDEWDDDLGDILNLFVGDLQRAVTQNQPITSLVNNEFTHNDDYKFTMKRMKYLVIRYALESISLYKLIEQYEKCLQDLLEANNKLEELQQ